MAKLDPLERITDLLLVLLDAKRPLSRREIMLRVPGYPESDDASRQGFVRDCNILKSEGVPLVSSRIAGDDQVGYSIDAEKYYLPDLALDADEQAALNLAVAGVHLGDPTGKEALSKLGMGGQWPVRGAVQPLVDLSLSGGLVALPVLFEAVRSKAVVTFTYRGEFRTVDVAGIRFRGGHWYAVGWDRDRTDARIFRVDRIDDIPQPGDVGSAAFPDDFDPDEAFARSPWNFGTGEALEVDIAVDAVEASRVVTELGADSVIERTDDGAVVIQMSVTDVPALISWVMDFLDHAEILRPPEVRAAMVERLGDYSTPGAQR